ncbi:MAG: GC-type dockerin domain-anchored protein [Planctomycetota bacterium]
MKYNKKLLCVAGMLVGCMSSAAMAQGPYTMMIDGPATAGPGDTVSLTLMFDGPLGSAGIFGDAGLQLFAGDIVGNGPATASAAAINPNLNVGIAPGSVSGAGIDRIGAARGQAPGLMPFPAALAQFDVTIDAGAAGGDSVVLTYAGGAAVDQDGTIQSLDTNPTVFQGQLNAQALVIDIVAGCNRADLAAPFGILNSTDINAFVGAFLNDRPAADLAEPVGILNSSDINAFVADFLGGCP